MARKRNWAQTNDVYVGVVGGQGIGDYLNGLATAAVQDADGFRALTEIGAYTGLAHLWLTDEKSHPKLWSNAAYGYLFTDTAATTDSPTERMQQAWANVIWQVNMNWALGLEYHFGMREVADGREGENHRIQFVMKFGTAGSDERAYSDSTAHLHRL
jgi:hypothetical protein